MNSNAEQFRVELIELCRKFKVELAADEYDCHTNVWDIPREVDLDSNGHPKEYPAFKFVHVGPTGVDLA